MESIKNYINDHLLVTIIIGGLLAITIYTIFVVFLNKLHNAKYGKPASLAWFPGINIFILGKAVVHWSLGLVLFIALLFGICISFNIPYLESIHSLLPSEYVFPYQVIFGVTIVVLTVVGKIELNSITQKGSSKEEDLSFVNKDYNKEEQVPTPQPVNNSSSNIRDNFQYNSALAKLNNQKSNNDQQKPQN